MKINIRKTLIALSACIVMINIIGCGASDGKSSSSSGNDSTVITIAARDGSHTDVLEAVKSEFEQNNNCTINIVSMSSNDIYSTVLEDAKNETGRYDIIMIDDPLMPEYIEKGILENLTQLGYLDDEDFVEKSRLLGKDPYPLGATYALPFSGNVQLIFFNHNLISQRTSLDNWEEI